MKKLLVTVELDRDVHFKMADFAVVQAEIEVAVEQAAKHNGVEVVAKATVIVADEQS